MLSSDGEALMPGTAARNTSGRQRVEASRRSRGPQPRRRWGAHAALAPHAQRRRREAARVSQGPSAARGARAQLPPAGLGAVRGAGGRRGWLRTRTWLAQQALNLLRAVARPRSVAGLQSVSLQAPRRRALMMRRGSALFARSAMVRARAAGSGEPPPGFRPASGAVLAADRQPAQALPTARAAAVEEGALLVSKVKGLSLKASRRVASWSGQTSPARRSTRRLPARFAPK